MTSGYYSFQGDILKIPVLVKKEDIVFIDRVMEGYGHLGLVTAVDSQKGLVYVQVTLDTKRDVLLILANFPKEIRILKDYEAQEILTVDV